MKLPGHAVRLEQPSRSSTGQLQWQPALSMHPAGGAIRTDRLTGLSRPVRVSHHRPRSGGARCAAEGAQADAALTSRWERRSGNSLATRSWHHGVPWPWRPRCASSLVRRLRRGRVAGEPSARRAEDGQGTPSARPASTRGVPWSSRTSYTPVCLDQAACVDV